MKLDCAGLLLRRGVTGLVGNEQHLGAQEGALLIEFKHLKAPAAFRNQIETSVGILFCYGDDLGGAAHFGKAFVESADDAERRVAGAAFRDHLLVTRLEDVQRQGSAGQQYDFEREQGKKWPRNLPIAIVRRDDWATRFLI